MASITTIAKEAVEPLKQGDLWVIVLRGMNGSWGMHRVLPEAVENGIPFFDRFTRKNMAELLQYDADCILLNAKHQNLPVSQKGLIAAIKERWARHECTLLKVLSITRPLLDPPTPEGQEYTVYLDSEYGGRSTEVFSAPEDAIRFAMGHGTFSRICICNTAGLKKEFMLKHGNLAIRDEMGFSLITVRAAANIIR